MLLRESGEVVGNSIGLEAVMEGGDAQGVDDGDALLAFAEALVARDQPATARARDSVIARMGTAAMVDAAAVASNFERMTRIADATGITLGERLEEPTASVRADLGLERFDRAGA